jgi:hypothetical protein
MRRLDWMAAVSGSALLVAAFLGTTEGTPADSPLFIAAVAAPGALVASCAVLRRAVQVRPAS